MNSRTSSSRVRCTSISGIIASYLAYGDTAVGPSRKQERPKQGHDIGSAEARDVDRFLGDEFEQCRGAFAGFLDAATDRSLDLARLGHALAVAAQRLGEIGVMAAD